MNVYVISQGLYEEERVVDVVMQEDFPAYKQKKLSGMYDKMQKYLDGLTGESAVVKMMVPISEFCSVGPRGHFGVRCEFLRGTTEIAKSDADDSMSYEFMAVWKVTDK